VLYLKHWRLAAAINATVVVLNEQLAPIEDVQGIRNAKFLGLETNMANLNNAGILGSESLRILALRREMSFSFGGRETVAPDLPSTYAH
jgi:hypothetical protein